MRNNRIALGLVYATASALAWLIVLGAGPAAAQTPGPAAQPLAGQAPATTPGAPAKPAAETPPEPPTEAEIVIDAAIKKLAAVKSVSADLHQSVKMLGQDFEIKGRLLKGPESRIYLKMTLNGLPGSTGTMLQVCDGETLWTYQQILETQQYQKLSVKPVFELLNSPDLDPTIRDQAFNALGFAGPEALLIGVRKAVKFDQKEEGELDGKPVYILRGSWRDRTGLFGPDQQPAAPIGFLPPYMPSHANLYLGKDDGWPYNLDLLGKALSVLVDTRPVGPDGRKQGKLSDIQRPDPSEIHLVYSNVQFGAVIRPEEFAFQAPANANIQDNTQVIVKGLQQSIDARAMQKRAEAAKNEGAVLEQPLEVPAPAAAPSTTPAAPK